MEVAVKGDNKTEADTSDIQKCDSQEYILRKRLPRRLPKRPNDVYVSRKTDFRAQLARQADVIIQNQRRVQLDEASRSYTCLRLTSFY